MVRGFAISGAYSAAADVLSPLFMSARYNSGVKYGAARYRSLNPETPQKPKHMAKIKYTVSKQNVTQLVAQAELSAGKVAPASPATPPLPNMAAKTAALLVKSDAAKADELAYTEAKAGLVALKAAAEASRDELRAEHTSYVAALESEAKGDPVLLTATGYPITGEATATTHPPGKVMNLNLTWSDADGALDGSNDPEELATSGYEVQVTTVDPVAGPYQTVLHPRASRWELTGLSSGQRVWVRVRAIGTKGAGPWSDPATKIVP